MPDGVTVGVEIVGWTSFVDLVDDILDVLVGFIEGGDGVVESQSLYVAITVIPTLRQACL